MMVFAAKGNKVRRIDEASIQKFADQGYTITDEKGNILKKSVPTDLVSLKTAYAEHLNIIRALEDEVASLKAQLAKATAKVEKASKKETSEDKKAKKSANLDIATE